MPEFVDRLVHKLRYHGLSIGVDDLVALRMAVAGGFGLSGTADLRELYVMLWASTRDEAATVRAVFAQADPPDWEIARADETGNGPADVEEAVGREPSRELVTATAGSRRETDIEPLTGLPGVHLPALSRDPSLILNPQYPLGAREIAQVWRRLRRAVRQGPAVELDFEATLRRRGRDGVATPPVLVPRYRNTAELLLLIDRQGSMTPYHGYVDHVRSAIQAAGRLDTLRVVYFHDTPDRLADRSALRRLSNPIDPRMDDVLPGIEPMTGAVVYDDPDLALPRLLEAVLGHWSPRAAIAVISDAGAARKTFDPVRLVESIALTKALLARSGTLCWLNPVPPERWKRATAEQIARHVPMFPFTRQGMCDAVEVLRGRLRGVERPL